MAQRGWKPTGWLGIVLAGAIWSSLEEDQLEANVDQLVAQIQVRRMPHAPKRF